MYIDKLLIVYWISCCKGTKMTADTHDFVNLAV